MNGTTRNTRLLGCAFLYPHVIPDPFTSTITLRHDDEFIIIANRGLWKFVGYDEAVQEVYEIGNPIVAAKKLQDLAQGYGSKENIAVLVIRLNTDSGPSLGRLRKNRSMSIDDVEAAAQHEARMEDLPARLRASTGKIRRTAPPAPVVIHEPEPEPIPTEPEMIRVVMPEPVIMEPEMEPEPAEGEPPESPQAEDYYVKRTINVDGSPIPSRKSPSRRSPSRSPSRSPLPQLRPLPNQRFRKKNAASDWETVLQKRLANEVKDKEMRFLSQTIGESDDELDVDREATGPDLDLNDGPADKSGSVELNNWTSGPTVSTQQASSKGLSDSKGKFGSIGRSSVITTPWTDTSNRKPNTANPAYFHTLGEGEDNDDLPTSPPPPQNSTSPPPPQNPTSPTAPQNPTANGGSQQRPQVSRMIGMFENINRQSMATRQSFRSQNRDRSASRDRSQSGDRTLLRENGQNWSEPEVPIYAQVKKSKHRGGSGGIAPQSEPNGDGKPVIVEIARL